MRLSFILILFGSVGLVPVADAADAVVPAVSTASDERIIYPGAASGTQAPALSSGSGTRGLTTMLGVALLAGVGGWLVWKKRQELPARRDARLLAVDETRPLGNRQYLVVASYDGRKFLLGVCPGRIDLLSPLDEAARREPPLAS